MKRIENPRRNQLLDLGPQWSVMMENDRKLDLNVGEQPLEHPEQNHRCALTGTIVADGEDLQRFCDSHLLALKWARQIAGGPPEASKSTSTGPTNMATNASSTLGDRIDTLRPGHCS